MEEEDKNGEEGKGGALIGRWARCAGCACYSRRVLNVLLPDTGHIVRKYGVVCTVLLSPHAQLRNSKIRRA